MLMKQSAQLTRRQRNSKGFGFPKPFDAALRITDD
jgi:hypothetical protein